MEGTEAMAEQPIEDWTQIPWRKLEQHVYRLQKRIYKASCRGNVKAVHSLQRLLMKSQAARTLAVRRVTQDNQGKKTAGVDGIKSVRPEHRPFLVERLRNPATIKPQPVRRVYIPKPGKSEKRPLGIPVMLDRAHQALVKLALEPEWEARFEANSYGFRPGRSAHDAMVRILTLIGQKSKFILDADITGCFDNIEHTALLDKLQTFPALRQTIKGWLKAGAFSEGRLILSTQGTPQGGVISPLLTNAALHGLETTVKATTGADLVRYADDFVCFHPTREGIDAAQQVAEKWLGTMGLKLHPDKTRIVHTLEAIEGRTGCDFLGFSIRQYRRGQYRCARSSKGKPLGFKTLIKPSKEATKRHVDQLGKIIRTHRSAAQRDLIDNLNPIIRGWSNYYRTMVATGTFSLCDHLVMDMLRRWAKRRHPRKTGGWVMPKYWRRRGNRKWCFTAPDGNHLALHAATPIKRHVKVRGAASPYDGHLLYWGQRLQNHPLTGSYLAQSLKRQEWRCAECGLLFRDGDVIEIDHIQPTVTGGTDIAFNRQAIHRHCHDRKTARDGSYDSHRQRGIDDKRPHN